MKLATVILSSILIVLFSMQGYAQQVAINEDGSLPNLHAILDIKSFNKGVLIPRMSTANRLGIPNVKGLLVYDTTIGSFWYNTGTLWQSLAGNSSPGSGWLVTGNSGTSEAHFLGTTDFKPLRIRVHDEPSGLLDPANGNCFWGYNSGTFSNADSVYFNTATGYYSLHHNTAGSLNTTMGDYSMFSNTTGNANTAIGDLALYSNTTGSDNTAIGSFSLFSNTTAGFNTATGSSSLMANIIGYNNTANGNGSLRYNTAGNYNTAIGSFSLYSNTTGNFNTATGLHALNNSNNGSFNTASGVNALSGLTIGDHNTAFGNYSLGMIQSGNNNTAIGSFSGVAIQNAVNATAVGYGAYANTSNKVRIGNGAVTAIEGAVPFTTPSDSRYKFNVQDDVKGLGFILQLRPVTYQFDAERFDAQWPKPVDTLINSYTDEIKDSYTKASLIRRSGFIAQDVKRAADASGYAFSGLIAPATEQEHYSLSYESFVVPLVKAVQEQQQIIAGLQKQLTELKRQISTLK